MENDADEFCFASAKHRSDKDLAMDAVRRGMSHYDAFGETLWDDPVFVRAVLRQSSEPSLVHSYMSERLSQDPAIMWAVVKQDMSACLPVCSPELRGNANFMLRCLARELGRGDSIDSDTDTDSDSSECARSRDRDSDSSGTACLSGASTPERDVLTDVTPEHDYADSEDPTILSLSEVYSRGDELTVLPMLSDTLRGDIEFMKKAVRMTTLSLMYCSDALKANAEIMKYAVKRTPRFMALCSDSLKDDRDFMLAVVTARPQTIAFASARIRGDPEIALVSISCDCSTVPHLEPPAFRNRALVSKLIAEGGEEVALTAVRHCGDELRHDAELMLEALRQTQGEAWLSIPASLRREKAFALRCLEEDIELYSVMLLDQRCDKDIALKACVSPSEVPYELLGDKEFAIAYLSQGPSEAKRCDEFEALLGDPDVILAAAQHTPSAVGVALPSVQRDPDAMLLAAHATDGESLRYIKLDMEGLADFYLKIAQETEYAASLPTAPSKIVMEVAQRIGDAKKKCAFIKAMQKGSKNA
eukprot:TRINITY_DN15044_c0_g2_i1.p1 TRINITY_DN15044_c0_g2~~TRINITY_DN15044_c0_g2_i1.p1  ORF type:complete len:572 (+),score=154.82 TRINITY_DN15044_c0_g2_i1:126-1718(+)